MAGFNFSREEDIGGVVTKISTPGEVAKASFQESINAAETSSILRMLKMNQLSQKNEPLIDYKELNKEYQLETPLNRDISRSMFDEMVKRDKESKERRDIISRGEPGLLNTAATWGPMIGGQVIDPVGLAMSAFVGAGVTRTLGKIAKGAVVAEKELTTGAKIARGMTEGVVGNIISETAFVMPASAQEQRDVNTYESYRNAVLGGAGFPLVTGLIGGSYRLLKGLKNGEETLGKAMNLVEQQLQNGKRPNLTAFLSAAEKEGLDEIKEIRNKMAEGRDNYPDPSKVDEFVSRMDEHIDRIEKTEIDPNAERIRANSDEESIAPVSKAKEFIATQEKTFEAPKHMEEMRMDVDQKVADLEAFKKQEKLDAEDIEMVEAVKSDLNKADNMEEIIDSVRKCAI